MGDRISVEIKKKQKTLSGLFLKFAVLFCVNTVLIIAGNILLALIFAYAGLTLPANYAENRLTEYTGEIRSAGNSPEKWIPAGCSYGIFDGEGNWISGDFTEEERKTAWTKYKNENIYASSGNYYRFIRQENGNVCIVRYDLYMKYSWDALNRILPRPELLLFVLDGVFFILNAVFLSRYFAGRVNRQLEELRGITEKIGSNDLEFETHPSDIREIDAVMSSLSHMKETLRESLTAQWDMEQQKQEQLASLTHDIKTPLTIIKGNAELLAEAGLSPENRECTEYILSNVGDIEGYLEHIRQVLYGISEEHKETTVSCTRMVEMLRQAAAQVAAAEKIPVIFDIEIPEEKAARKSEEMEQSRGTGMEVTHRGGLSMPEMSGGEISCVPESILRAWKNVLSNGAERTDKELGIEVRIRLCIREGQKYLESAVRDYGPGFSRKDLEYASREFYSGDTSRHDRKHQGLGLAIAKRFLEEQGGLLKFGNHKKGGAEVKCLIRVN
ncbi:MAG TPA: HAMP domain-containing histidine kinase [Candidatus Blautia intestinavium]|nr:HAMP domain-containing histidine kinase [Candidatus Blautia intestinavium]